MSSWRQILALYRALLDQQLTKSRLLLVSGFGVLAFVLALSIGAQVEADVRIQSVVGFLSVYGLGFMVPILSLLFASSALGQLVEDETLVYIWLRPNPRWQLATAAWAAAATIALPVSVVPLAASAAIGSGGDATTIWATALSMGLAAIGYSGLFVLLGLVFRRALLWGLVYVFIWELFVARAGAGAARLSLNTYPHSVLARLTEIELPLAERSMAAGLIVPPVVAAVAVAATAWWLNRAEIT
jgi:ABC-2 type transport system permease protein